MKYFALWIIALTMCGSVACQTVDEDALSSENVWGEAGAVAYPRAAQRMANQSPAGFAMDVRDREAIRPVFGDLVDRVSIHWDSQPLDEIASSEFGVQFGSGDTQGQTYGLEIYIRGPRVNWPDERRLEILIHELTHSEQFERNGSDLSAFGYRYFQQYYIAGQIYERNLLEVEAINKANAELQATLQRFQNL